MKLLIFISLFCAHFAFAQEETETTAAPIAPAPVAGSAERFNFLSTGLQLSDFKGLYVAYAMPVQTHWLLGTRVTYGKRTRYSNDADYLIGDWDYYQEEAIMLDLNATVYFRGYGKWGPLIRAGVGYSYHKAKAQWGKDDLDWGWPFEGNHDAEESFKTEWYSGFGRIGLAYQFAWGFHNAARVGHILEIGVTGTQFLNQHRLSHRKADGNMASTNSAPIITAVELGYTIAF